MRVLSSSKHRLTLYFLPQVTVRLRSDQLPNLWFHCIQGIQTSIECGPTGNGVTASPCRTTAGTQVNTASDNTCSCSLPPNPNHIQVMLPSRAPSRRRPSRPSPYLPYPRPLTRPSHLSILTNRLTSHLPRSPRRRFLLLFAVLFVAHVLFGYGQRDVRRLFPSFFGDGSGEIDEPPTWVALRRCQANLPQHNLDLPAPEGRHGRYVYFGNEIKKLGWNNCLNEVSVHPPVSPCPSDRLTQSHEHSPR